MIAFLYAFRLLVPFTVLNLVTVLQTCTESSILWWYHDIVINNYYMMIWEVICMGIFHLDVMVVWYFHGIV